MRKLLYILFFLCLTATCYAQPTMDTIRQCLKQKPHLFGKFDTRNSFIENSRAKIFGLKAGLNYGGRLHFGIGYNQLNPPSSDFDKEIYTVNSFGEIEKTTAMLRLFYFSLHAEYIFYQTRHWQLSMPLQLGFGQTYYKYNLLGKRIVIDKDYNFIYEPAISIEYKFVKWAGVGADIGYRFMLTDYERLNKKFTSPTYAFKFLIYYNEIVKSAFPKSKLAKRL
ncbi:MAG TPA: hypothetical protein VGC65_00875 [Bacteroidia bacterium]